MLKLRSAVPAVAAAGIALGAGPGADAGLGRVALEPCSPPEAADVQLGQPRGGFVATHRYRILITVGASSIDYGSIAVEGVPGLVSARREPGYGVEVVLAPLQPGRFPITVSFKTNEEDGPQCIVAKRLQVVVKAPRPKRSSVFRANPDDPYLLRLNLFERAGLDFDASPVVVRFVGRTGRIAIPNAAPRPVLRYALDRIETGGEPPFRTPTRRRVGDFTITAGGVSAGSSSAALAIDISTTKLRDGADLRGGVVLDVLQRGRAVARLRSGFRCHGIGSLQRCSFHELRLTSRR